MFRFAQVFVLIVAIAWIEPTRCYLKTRRGEHQRAFDRTFGVGAGTRYRDSEAQLAMGLESADGNQDAPDDRPGGDNCVVRVHKLGWLAARIAVKMSGLQMSTPGSYRTEILPPLDGDSLTAQSFAAKRQPLLTV